MENFISTETLPETSFDRSGKEMTSDGFTSINRTENTTEDSPAVMFGCRVSYREFKFFPWNNVDNIITLNTLLTGTKIISGILVPLICLTGISFNTLNCVIFRKQGLRERINLLLFCLALSDVVVTAYLFVHSIEFFYTQLQGDFQMYGPLTTFFVNNALTMLYGSVYVSGFISTLIACERCICITIPLKAKRILKTRTTGIIVLCAAVVLVGLHYIVSEKYKIGCEYYPDKGFSQYVYFPSKFYMENTKFVNILNGAVYGTSLPVFFFLTTSTTTIITALKLKGVVEWRQSTSSAAVEPKEIALTKMLIAVSCLFIACNIPNIFVKIVPVFLPEFKLGGRNQNLLVLGVSVLYLSATINSSLNFFFYMKMSSKYRSTLKMLCGKSAPRSTH